MTFVDNVCGQEVLMVVQSIYDCAQNNNPQRKTECEGSPN